MSATLTLWNKYMSKLVVHPEETVGMLIQPVLWVVLFGVGMKSLLGAAMPVAGDVYVTFMLPGIVALSVLGGAVGGGSVWLQERLSGVVKEYVAAPVPRVGILLGNALAVVTKSLIQGIVIVVVGVLIGAQLDTDAVGWLLAVLLTVGFAIGFSGIALAAASRIDDMGGYHSVIMLLNLPLLFLSNALYPLDTLPRWMEIGARLNPTSYFVDGVRQTVLQGGEAMAGSEVIGLGWCCLGVATFAAFGLAVAALAFRASLRRA